MSNLQIMPGTRREHAYPWEDDAWIRGVAEDLRRADATFDGCRVDGHTVTRDLFDEVGHVVASFPDDFAPLGEHRPPRAQALTAMFDAVRQWMHGIKAVEEEDIVLPTEVPLCAFNCPDVKDAKTSFAESKSTSGTAGWNIEVLGSGFGSDMTLSVSQTNTFVAAAGERKVVFAPLQMRIVKVALYKRSQFVDRFLKCEVAESTVRQANGIRSVDRAEWPGLIGNGYPLEHFDLSRNTGTGVTTYERAHELSGSFEAKLGLAAFNLKSAVTAKCSAKESVTLKFELPAGHVYKLEAPTAISGFYFD